MPQRGLSARRSARTSVAIFLTRWITHGCAPAFMLLAAWALVPPGGATPTSRFLWTRGVWLVLLELTLVRFGFFFNVKYDFVFLLVFWALGFSMIALAVLVRLPYWATLAVSVGLIVLHNLADGIRAESLGRLAWLWQVLHQQGLLISNPPVIVGYPLVPWIGVMGLGFCLGRAYRLPEPERRRLLVGLGVAMTVAFILLRAWNGFGDPRPWSVQPRPGFALLSFLNTTSTPRPWRSC
jgi:uncharacterized membrane protein